MKAFPRFCSSIFTRIKAHDLRVSRHKEWLPIMISGVYLGQDYEGSSGTIRIENGELRHGQCVPIPFAEDEFLQKRWTLFAGPFAGTRMGGDILKRMTETFGSGMNHRYWNWRSRWMGLFRPGTEG